MTIKHLTGAYPYGYALSAKFTGLDIAATASVGGTGVSASFLATITNRGAVTAESGHNGVSLAAGGSVTNGAATDTTALIVGSQGVVIKGAAGTITNYGVIDGESSTGVTLYGGLVTNGSAADIRATILSGVNDRVSAATIVNFGTIGGGASLYGGQVTNGSATDTTATIGYVHSSRAVTIANYGAIGNGSSTGVTLYGGLVTNGSATDIEATILGGVDDGGPAATIANFGTIGGRANLSGGLVKNGTVADTSATIEYVHSSYGVTIDNYGVISGGATFYYGVFKNGSVTDTAATAGYAYADISYGDPRTRSAITNYGAIVGGVTLAGGTVRNGSDADTTASIKLVHSTRNATVNNYGTISAGIRLYYGIVNNGSANDTISAIGYVHLSGGYGQPKSSAITNYGTISVGVRIYYGIINNGSAMDTTATMGYLHTDVGYGQPKASTITNYGTISGGVTFFAGNVRNGSVADTTATMGYLLGSRGAAVVNYGTIRGIATPGARLGGGTLINGSASDTGALVMGAVAGVVASYGTETIRNFGTIDGSYDQGALILQGAVTNGSATDRAALIEGAAGVEVVRAFSTITNFGTIWGTVGPSVRFDTSGDVLQVEAGSAFLGAVLGDGGALDLASGVGTISGLTGGNVTVSGSMAATKFTNFGTLEVAAGAAFTLTDAALIAPGATHALNVEGTLTLAGALTLGGRAALNDDGVIDQTSTILLRRNAAAARLIVDKGAIYRLDGDVGMARRMSENPEITVEGEFVKSAGAGVSAVGVYVEVDGVAAAAMGTLDFMAGVTGTGTLQVGAGATLECDRAVDSGLTASFTGVHATLALKDPSAFGATIGGFADGDSIDLLGITATSASLGAGDTLVITNGAAPVATLQLTGDYAGAAFSTASDGKGGTSITVATTPGAGPPAASHATLHPFIAAAASFGGRNGAAWLTAQAHAESLHSPLAAPRMQTA